MHVLFSLPDLLRLFKHLRGSRDQGIIAHPELRITAIEGQIFLENPHLAAGVAALVIEPGAFTFSRLRLHALLRSCAGRETLTLEAEPSLLKVGTLRVAMPLLDFEPAPRLPAFFNRSQYQVHKVPSPAFTSGAYSLSFGDGGGNAPSRCWHLPKRSALATA